MIETPWCDEGQLPPEVLSERETATNFLLPKHHEIVARCLRNYLANAGDFTYSLHLERKDPKIDPVEDFLYNTKSGHCQRFASALALMLRSVGVPCQIAIGFKGCESRGDGWYKVRASSMHTPGVEVLDPCPISRFTHIFRPLPPHNTNEKPDPTQISYHWLSLDPEHQTAADIGDDEAQFRLARQRVNPVLSGVSFSSTIPSSERMRPGRHAEEPGAVRRIGGATVKSPCRSPWSESRSSWRWWDLNFAY